MQINLKCSYSESRKHGRLSRRKIQAPERTATESRPLAPAKLTMPITVADQTGWESLLTGSEPFSGDQTWEAAGEQQFDTAVLSSWPEGVFNTGELDSWALAVPADPSTEPSQSSINNSSTHNCEAEAISILNSMQHGEMYQGLTSCSTDPAQAYATLILSPSFDRVLAVNKTAREGWNKLVRCSCALCPHLLLLYTSILSKMLFWYRIAATEKLEDDAASSSGSSRYSPDEAPTVDRFSIRPTTIQVGILSLDAEEQAHMRRVLLLRELRTTAKAIDDLLVVDRTSLKSADEFIRIGVEWALTGISRQREELQSIIRLVKETQ
ncbi:uncharacterized protein BHQ10_003775 [Talaromyces amestolkiae]|uniref:Aflatoxin regulatory protein domain-containing protein n=1 Tax=Talaromyces amestolkiae TaxID=1196081 RepID=A0A364KW53_TALAM|nr:uncharacterized protein BHQ10_003775 [Talaromyces amestolkiae]RAO67763.1 hypothetical protein BHQ10_003775 [Talaromyces amestolkiae]